MKKIIFLVFILISSNLKANNIDEISAHIIGEKCIVHDTSEFLFKFENSQKYRLLINQNVKELKNKLLSQNNYDEVFVSYDPIGKKLEQIESRLFKISEEFQSKFSKELNDNKLNELLSDNSELGNMFFVDEKESIYSSFSDNFFFGPSFKLCKFHDLSSLNSSLILNFPKDFPFIIYETEKIQYPVESDQVLYGTVIEGQGTVYGIENCKTEGFIYNNCSQIALGYEEGVIFILTQKLSLKEKYKFKIGSNISFNSCILTEIQNPRGMAGYEFQNYFKSLGDDVRQSVVEGIDAGRNSRDPNLVITDSLFSFSGKLLDSISLPKYVNSVTCETMLKKLKLISN